MATSLTQADLDKLAKAIVSGVLRVTYSSGTVEYQSIDQMMKAHAFGTQQLGGTAANGGSMTSLAVFDRGC
jgi:hypothetical protein